MPAVRLSRRRRSSLAICAFFSYRRAIKTDYNIVFVAFNPAKSGVYGIHSPSPRPVTFAPNVTPGTYTETDASSSCSTPEPGSPSSSLFPPSETPAPPPSRRRVPPGKRRSLGYIPRPPNAFMLFRADFVRQKHVPGSIETNHGSLSKIIGKCIVLLVSHRSRSLIAVFPGNCWRSLPLEDKRVWEVKAKHAKAEHKIRYPDYRFRPVHNKNKDKKKEKPATTLEDERRCEEVAQLLLEGKKGDELAAAVRQLDSMREPSPLPLYPHRRSSSVPLPGDWRQIALPSVPFLPLQSRPGSPVGISQSNRLYYGQRRASSARPAGHLRSWTMPTPTTLQRDDSPLPEVDTSLFEQSFLDSGFSFSNNNDDRNESPPFNFNDIFSSLPPHAVPHDLMSSISPLDNIAPHQLPNYPYQQHHPSSASSSQSSSLPELDAMIYHPLDFSHPQSHASSTYSGSPTLSDHSFPPVVAPQPQDASANMLSELLKEFTNNNDSFPSGMDEHSQSMNQVFDLGLDLDFSTSGGACDAQGVNSYDYTGLEGLFEQDITNQHQHQHQYNPSTGFTYDSYNDMMPS